VKRIKRRILSGELFNTPAKDKETARIVFLGRDGLKRGLFFIVRNQGMYIPVILEKNEIRQVSSRICHRISHQAGSGFHNRGMLMRVRVPGRLQERYETEW